MALADRTLLVLLISLASAGAQTPIPSSPSPSITPSPPTLSPTDPAWIWAGGVVIFLVIVVNCLYFGPCISKHLMGLICGRSSRRTGLPPATETCHICLAGFSLERPAWPTPCPGCHKYNHPDCLLGLQTPCGAQIGSPPDPEEYCAQNRTFTEREIATMGSFVLAGGGQPASERFTAANAGLRICPTCKHICLFDGVAPVRARCGYCGIDFCWVCSRVWHLDGRVLCGNRDCGGADAANALLLATCGTKSIVYRRCRIDNVPIFRRCPRNGCGRLLQHTGDDKCKMIVCTTCNQSFCFACLALDGTCGGPEVACRVAPGQQPSALPRR